MAPSGHNAAVLEMGVWVRCGRVAVLACDIVAQCRSGGFVAAIESVDAGRSRTADGTGINRRSMTGRTDGGLCAARGNDGVVAVAGVGGFPMRLGKG
jgi:hypothetical protein